MGSLNDYGRRPVVEKVKGGGFKRRILIQTALAVAFFFLVAAFVSADNFLGEGARYVAGEGVDVESSWVSFDDGSAVEVSADPAQETEGTPADTVEEETEPRFTAPASGIVVTDLAVAVSGFSTEQGILIQGSAGQNVKAAADGEVRYLGESEDGYMVELLHSGGFTSIYQGLSSIEVGTGDTVEIGSVIGATEDGEVTFSLYLDGEELNPLEYLFQ